MARPITVTFDEAEARALTAKLEGQPVNENYAPYKEGLRKLRQAIIEANPLERRRPHGPEPRE